MKHIVELDNGNRVTIEDTCESFYRSRNTDRFYTMRFVFRGVEKCTLGHRTMNIFPDSFAVFNIGTVYSACIDDPTVSALSIEMESSFVEDFNKVLRLEHEGLLDGACAISPIFTEALYPFTGEIRDNIAELKALVESRVADDALINSSLHRCLLNYYGIYRKEVSDKLAKLSSLKSSTRGEVLRRLLLAKDFINSSFNHKICLEDIASHSCLSVNHLLRTFGEVYGSTPWHYLKQVRLERAKILLATTNLPIRKVGLAVGFKSTAAFIRLFGCSQGITPSRYRKLTSDTYATEWISFKHACISNHILSIN